MVEPSLPFSLFSLFSSLLPLVSALFISFCLLLFSPYPSFSLFLDFSSPQLRVQSPPEMSPSLAEQREQQRTFLEQLLDTSKLENYTVPIPIKADLRKYQQVR